MDAMAPMPVFQNYHERLPSGHGALMLVAVHALRLIIVNEHGAILFDEQFDARCHPRRIDEAMRRMGVS